MSGSSASDGTPVPAAELHSFRTPPDNWLLLLVRLRRMGANTISTCVPWGWHKPQSGVFDFTGANDPQRNLVRFVHLCRLPGLHLILKPGPFVDLFVSWLKLRRRWRINLSLSMTMPPPGGTQQLRANRRSSRWRRISRQRAATSSPAFLMRRSTPP